ncbi:MAG: endonuclease/exonuclease/phosphatase [Phycisphaeraceae bacterium]|nr:endonuclease/exonuclease/phosphatase [Phycisphaeraceae bacterium]
MPEHYVSFWNVENLFDVRHAPDRSEKLQRAIGRELTGWTRAVLDRKISQLARVVRSMNDARGPDLLGVCEIENRRVLELLAGALSSLGRNYRIVHHDMSDRRGIDVAFIYDVDILQVETKDGKPLCFSHYIQKRVATRDLFQVNFLTAQGNRLFVIGNHWPARLGGQYSSEPYRMMAGETLAYFHQRIREIHDDTHVAVLAMGDFNDEPLNRSLQEYAQAERVRSKVTRARSAKFLNVMWPLMGVGQGTHYYDNEPGMLDQFLASRGLVTGRNGIEVDVDSVEIVRHPDMVSSGTYPAPIRFGRGASMNRDGYSDHFPIALRLHE